MSEISAAQLSIAQMLQGYSIELHPGERKILDLAPGRLDPETEVFLTWIPGTDPSDMITAAGKLRRSGLLPVPHIGARHLESATQLEQIAARLAGEAGVDRVLIVGGDRPRPAGPYDNSLAVMQTGVFQRAGILRIAVAGFPEGNPYISETILDEALEAKVDFGRSSGLQLSIVTQFCFRPEPIVSWLRRLRARGINLPVRVGLAGPAAPITLARYAVRCGIGNSLHVLTENSSFARLLIERGPEPIIQGLAHSAEGGKTASLPSGVAGLHFFVFGGFNKTVDWINAQRAE
ncbi:MAG TPA: methylenetetrahydrofolate reductase [Candidatus Acidoferrum sp.]|nr:methylenetetrahydrofolate reductase [Candidatus Acidoferrum sp.]